MKNALICRDAPLYLEWAPSDILSPIPKSNNEEQNNLVGEEKLNNFLIRQAVEGIAEEEIDPDRIEVWHPHSPSCLYECLCNLFLFLCLLRLKSLPAKVKII